ncbi:unnamed protein product [Camellia sinensis]
MQLPPLSCYTAALPLFFPHTSPPLSPSNPNHASSTSPTLCLSNHLPYMAALAAETKLAEETEQLQEDVVVTLTKPKKGKAALPLKSDRFGDRRRSKRFLEIQKLRENKKEYDLKTAISLLKQMAITKFVETAEAHFSLNIDPKYNDQQLRATSEKFDEAKNAGADLVGGEDLIGQIKGGFVEFDKLIATPDMMPKVAQLGKILGPRGLMPNPKAGTVTTNLPQVLRLSQAIEEFKKGKVGYRADKTGIVHLTFGKSDFSEEDLLVNLLAAAKSVETKKPSGAKGVCWKSAHICSSMGPSIRFLGAEVAEETEQLQEGVVESGVVVTPTKPKKGKVALPLKSDRRFLEIQKLRENKKEYDLKTAISLLKQMASTKFVETAEAHFRLNIDPKYNGQQLRVNLPKGTGPTVRVAVLTQG